jgi:hypothetical protein
LRKLEVERMKRNVDQGGADINRFGNGVDSIIGMTLGNTSGLENSAQNKGLDLLMNDQRGLIDSRDLRIQSKQMERGMNLGDFGNHKQLELCRNTSF